MRTLNFTSPLVWPRLFKKGDAWYARDAQGLLSTNGGTFQSLHATPVFATLERLMTTSKETEWMNHPRLRKLVTAVNELTLAERLTLVKGLVPAIADELSDTEYEKFVDAIRLKGERFHEAQAHPGEGRAERKIPGDRDIEGR
jgi:hypothetical protein